MFGAAFARRVGERTVKWASISNGRVIYYVQYTDGKTSESCYQKTAAKLNLEHSFAQIHANFHNSIEKILRYGKYCRKMQNRGKTNLLKRLLYY